jgi:hypothetical protein
LEIRRKKVWNNKRMMEDFEYTNAMVQPIKRLNLDNLVGKFEQLEGNNKYDELEVIFSPLHSDEYIITGNK